ncbi:hypothetical protein EDD85DRAFT_955275 [Armillaria nabsnona]|nr:hypothetical protein EDD85DRAFT_955275 [Armillaria nabsnona]
MSVEVDCLLPCDASRLFKVTCCGDTFSDLLHAARQAHDTQCLCEPSPCHDAWVVAHHPGDSPRAASPSSLRVNLQVKVSDFFRKETDLLVSFVDEAAWQDFETVDFTTTSWVITTSLDPHCLNGLGDGILQSGSGQPRVACKSLTAYDLVYSSGVIWADKTSLISSLAERSEWSYSLPLIRRPAGFGKTSFLAMLEFFHDVKHSDSSISDAVLKSTRISQYCTTTERVTDPHQDLVLTFDLSVPTVGDFSTSFPQYINSVLRKFLWKYQEELQLKPEKFPEYLAESAVSSLPNVSDLVYSRFWRLFIRIDNYNAPYLASGNSTEVNQWVERLLLLSLSRMLYDIRSGLIMGTADTPDPHLDPYNHNPLNMWADVATDLTNADITETAFGFTLDEIHQLEREFKVHFIDAELTPYYFGQATCIL